MRSNYGKKGGEGPTRGKKARSFIVFLPDGSQKTKRIFHEVSTPTVYAYKHDGQWYVAAVRDKDDKSMTHYTACSVVETAYDKNVDPSLFAGDNS